MITDMPFTKMTIIILFCLIKNSLHYTKIAIHISTTLNGLNYNVYKSIQFRYMQTRYN